MKSIRLLLTSFAILLGGMAMNASAQCTASFIDTAGFTGPNQIFFMSTSTTSSVANTQYTWYFNGGTPSMVQGFGSSFDTATVTYTTPGPHSACLVIHDTLTNCFDSTCYNVTVWNMVVNSSASGTNTACGACNGTASVYPWGGQSPYTYAWSNGATTQTISGLCAGTYNVTVSDQNGQTTTNSYTVTGTGGAGVSASTSSSNCYNATVSASATSGTAPYSYAWTYNGSNISNSQSTTVNNSGMYFVQITDANGCTDIDSVIVTIAPSFTVSTTSTNETCLSCCDGTASVAVSGGPVNQPFTYSWSNGATSAQVSGLCPGWYGVLITDTLNGCSDSTSVYIGAYTCPTLSGQITQAASEQAMVYLITENSGILTAVDSTVTDSMGYYYFTACPGTYYVKAALPTSHSQYNFFLPTYYVNSSLWGFATAVVVSSNTTGIDINMLTGTNPGGPGFVGGAISLGANRGEGDPVVNAQVILRDLNEEVVAFTRTDANGEYEFTGVAHGDYKIDVDLLNFESYPFMISVSSDNETIVDRNFVVEGGNIKPVTPTGVAELSALDFEIYPNPTNDVLNINGAISKVEIFNLLGESVMLNQNSAIGNMTLNVSDLASGQYIVKVSTENTSNFVQVIVK